jgi:hypothetical protein
MVATICQERVRWLFRRIGLIRCLLLYLDFWHMNSSLFLATLCLAITVAVGQFDYRLDAEWLQWKTRHRKLYGMVGDT